MHHPIAVDFLCDAKPSCIQCIDCMFDGFSDAGICFFWADGAAGFPALFDGRLEVESHMSICSYAVERRGTTAKKNQLLRANEICDAVRRLDTFIQRGD